MYTSSGENTLSSSSVPAFVTKLWTLVEDPSTDEMICWDANGRSFHVLDQACFAKEILPLYFKHNNIASFIRQLNMYGFRKVISNEAVNLKMDKDDMEFAHQFFVQGQERLLEFIKRKVPQSKVHVGDGVAGSVDDGALRTDEVQAVLSEVNGVKSRQNNMTVRLENLKLENEVLWREVASLRQMHMKQQHIVSKLIQFLVSVVGNQKHQLNTGLKRKAPPLMLGAAMTESPPVKMARDRPAEKMYQVESPQESPTSSAAAAGISIVTDEVPYLLTSEENQHRLENPADVTGSSIQPESYAANVVRTDTLEPLAVLNSGYPPSLELTDIFDDSEPIAAVPLDDVLPTLSSASTAATTTPSNATTPTATTSSPLLATTALALTDPKIEFDRNDLSSHLDMTHSQLSGLRELLSSSPQISIDPNMMLELFGYLDSSVPSVCVDDFHDIEHKAAGDSENNTQMKPDQRSSVIGNEVIQYMPAEDFSSLYDINDLMSSYQTMVDPNSLDNALLTTPTDEDVLESLYLMQPGTKTTQNGRQTEMEDVD